MNKTEITTMDYGTISVRTLHIDGVYLQMVETGDGDTYEVREDSMHQVFAVKIFDGLTEQFA